MKKTDTKKKTPKDYGRWDNTPIKVISKPTAKSTTKKVKRGK